MKPSSVGVPPSPCTSSTPRRPPRMNCPRFCSSGAGCRCSATSLSVFGSLSCSVIAHAHPMGSILDDGTSHSTLAAALPSKCATCHNPAGPPLPCLGGNGKNRLFLGGCLDAPNPQPV